MYERRTPAWLLGAAALVLCPALASAADPYAVEITAGRLNVRTGIMQTILGQITRGQRFAVTAENSGWLRIGWRGRQAWISGNYARRVNAELVEVTANTALNVRTGPSTGYRRLGTLPRGHRLVRLSTSGNWSRIQYDVRTAWSYSGYLKRVTAGSPPPAPPPAQPPAPPPTPPPPSSTGDALLQDVQARAIDSARRELAAGVREIGSTNTGPRVDVYARTAGMRTGLPWCAFFASFNYATAARELGRTFSGQRILHSVEKTRDWFNYRRYTESWTAANVAKWEANRARHIQVGPTRKWIALSGSLGHRYATSRNLPLTVAASWSALPLRKGDYVLWPRHVGLIESYSAASGRMVTLEGNTLNRVRRKTYELSSSSVRGAIYGFGRPAAGDFTK